jgi:glycosyltransferase involved in cell wall biosynthesis
MKPNSDRSMNILMICHHRRHKAVPRPHAMAKHLVERGHHVTLLVIDETRRFGISTSMWDGVQLVETPDLLWGRLRSGWDPWDTLNRLNYLSKDKTKYDLVHAFETRPATIYPALYIANKHKIPLVTDWNDWFGRGGIIALNRPKWYRFIFGGVETYFEENFRAGARGLTVISTGLKERAIDLGISPERILQLPNGTFPDLFVPRPVAECRQHVGLPLNIPILGFSSADSHFDLEVIMDALVLVARQFPDVRLLITGNASHTVMDLANARGVGERLIMTGLLPFEELPWYLGCADLFLLPLPNTTYNCGRWPNKMNDYLSLGRPTISNPTGDIKTLFEHETVGLLAQESAEDFAIKITSLLENKTTATQLGSNARRVAVEQFDWRVLIPRLEDFYLKVLPV